MNRFDDCLAFIAKWEGGFSDDPADRGGRTNLGVTQRVYDEWRGENDLPHADVKDMQYEEARLLYFDKYWKPAKCPSLPQPLDLLVFDTAVNMGVGRSAKFLQQCLGVDVDGSLGPKTLAALQARVSGGFLDTLCDDYFAMRQEFYHRIVERDPTQSKFIKGWYNRLSDLGRVTGIA